MQTEAERVVRWLESVGEPDVGSESRALQAMLGAMDARRQHPPLPRRTLLVAVLAAIVLGGSVAALAGIGGLFGGPPAPTSVKRAFFSRNGWFSPHILSARASQLIRVHTTSGDLVLWIAPTREGDLCLALQRPGVTRLTPACILRGQPPGRIQYEEDASPGVPSNPAIWGRAPNATASLAVAFEGGRSAIVRPQHGFFVVEVGSRKVRMLTALDRNGRVLARQRVLPLGALPFALFHPRADGSPRMSVAGKARVVLRLPTWAGELTMREAPSQYGGVCDWLIVGGVKPGASFCQPSLVVAGPSTVGFSVIGLHDRPVVVFTAIDQGEFASVLFRFADRHVVTVPVRNGRAMYAFPPITMLDAHRPLSYALLEASGRVLHSERLESNIFTNYLLGKNGPRMRRWVLAWAKTHPR